MFGNVCRTCWATSDWSGKCSWQSDNSQHASLRLPLCQRLCDQAQEIRQCCIHLNLKCFFMCHTSQRQTLVSLHFSENQPAAAECSVSEVWVSLNAAHADVMIICPQLVYLVWPRWLILRHIPQSAVWPVTVFIDCVVTVTLSVVPESFFLLGPNILSRLLCLFLTTALSLRRVSVLFLEH